MMNDTGLGIQLQQLGQNVKVRLQQHITANPVTCCCSISPVKLTSGLCSGALQAALLLLEKT